AIPHKGAVLTQITAWWLEQLEPGVEHHMLSARIRDVVDRVPALEPYHDQLNGRAMLCRRAEVFPIECVIRGYISGSAWKEYSAHGTLAGEKLPDKLTESMRLADPIFSPATKAEEGHDENITISRMAAEVGAAQAEELERLTRFVYGFGSEIAADRGIII